MLDATKMSKKSIKTYHIITLLGYQTRNTEKNNTHMPLNIRDISCVCVCVLFIFIEEHLEEYLKSPEEITR